MRVRLESKRWYDSPRWRKTREGWLRAHPFCVDPYKLHGVVLEPANHVDHIVPHKEDWALFWDPRNWQSLCHSCHSRKTATEDGGFGR